MDSPFKVMGRRVVAWLIDAIILFAIQTAVFFAMAKKDEDILRDVQSGDIPLDETLYGNVTINDTEWSIVGGDFLLYALIVLLAYVLYYWVLQGLTGWTIGKLATGIRTVRADGAAPGVGRAAARSFLWIADAFPYFIPNLTGFIVAMTNDERQRIGDKVASTYVVKSGAMGRPVGTLHAGGAVPPPPPPAPPAGATAPPPPPAAPASPPPDAPPPAS